MNIPEAISNPWGLSLTRILVRDTRSPPDVSASEDFPSKRPTVGPSPPRKQNHSPQQRHPLPTLELFDQRITTR